MRPIEEACYWMAASREAPEAPLDGSLATDIAVVGGGFTGFWTALALTELDPGISVAVLEKDVAGCGASGRNAGMLGETIDHSHQLAIAHFGFDEARRLAALGQTNVDEMAAFLQNEGVDCDLERSGRLFVALTPAHLDEAKRAVDVAASLGVDGLRLMGAAEMQSELRSPLYLGGVFAPGGGILDPVKLVHGLKRVAIRRGVKVFERTPVTGFTGSRVRTPGGTVEAERVVLATDAYTHHLFPRLLRYFIPLYDYILVSEPLGEEQLAAIGWRNRQGVTDGRTFFNYYRLTADDRVLFGTSEAKYYRPNRVGESCDHSAAHYAALRESFARHFPQLAGLEFPYAWGGPIASTTRLTPFFGSLERGRVVYGLGYTGHGIGSTRVAGRILAHMALDRPSALLDLAMVATKPFPYPPEPLRSLAVRAVTRSLRRVDDGGKPDALLRVLDRLSIGFSS